MDLHISYRISLKHHCVNKIMELWSKRTKASKTAKEYIFREWRRGTINLRVNRDDFIHLIGGKETKNLWIKVK